MAAKNLAFEVTGLLEEGYAPYRGEVDGQVYDGLKCFTKRRSAAWFVLGPRHLCLGCNRRCALLSPEGFQSLLPIQKGRPGKLVFASLPAISAAEMLEKFEALRPDQAAYVLNVSEREVRDLVEEGKLSPAGSGRPLRVTSKSVRRELGASS